VDRERLFRADFLKSNGVSRDPQQPIAGKTLHYTAALCEVERKVRKLEPSDRQRVQQE